MFKMTQNFRYALQNSTTSLLRIAKKYRGWKYNFTFWKSALSKKLGGKYALDSKIIWSSVHIYMKTNIRFILIALYATDVGTIPLYQ